MTDHPEVAARLGRWSTVLATVSLLLSLSAPAVAQKKAATEDGSRAGLFIQVDDGRLTVKAQEVPQREILEALATKLGFDLVIAGSLDAPRSLDLQRKPWEEVLKRAIDPASWSVVYDDAHGSSRPAKVMVFPPGAAQGPRPSRLPSGVVQTPATTPSIGAPALPPVPADSRFSREDMKGDLLALQERLKKAEEAREQLSALHAIAMRGGAADIAQALSQLSGQPDDIQEFLKILESQPGQVEEVRHAIKEMLSATEKAPQSR